MLPESGDRGRDVRRIIQNILYSILTPESSVFVHFFQAKPVDVVIEISHDGKIDDFCPVGLTGSSFRKSYRTSFRIEALVLFLLNLVTVL